MTVDVTGSKLVGVDPGQDLDEIVGRWSADNLGTVLGRDVVELVGALTGALNRLAILRRIACRLLRERPEEMMARRATQTLFLDAMSTQKLAELAERIEAVDASAVRDMDLTQEEKTWHAFLGFFGTALQGNALFAEALDQETVQTKFSLFTHQRKVADKVRATIRIRDLTKRRIANTVSKQLDSLLASMSSAQTLILERRLFASNPHTLQELAEQIGVTRERVRQIELRLSRTIEVAIGRENRMIATLLREQLDPVIEAAELERSIAEVFNDGSLREPAIDLARRILKSQLNYSCVDGVCFNKAATDVIAPLRDAAGQIADDVGLMDEEALRDHLPSGEWNAFFPQLIERCEFHRIGGRLALRDTAKARVKAALLKIGRPATKEEIAAVSEIDPDRVGGPLSNIPTLVRVDKTRWGLADWTDDAYEGIPAEIMQRINEDGGATPLERLFEELPGLFGVSESSVRAYVGTSQFTLHDSYVSLADNSSITLRDFDDVIDGRDALGNPYWTFLVEDRFFDGYSLVGLPPELAQELGCQPNGKTLARVTHPEGSSDLSVVWRLASTTGASLGYLADPLQRLGVSGGDRVRMVIKSPGVVALRRESNTVSMEESSDTSADSLLRRMKNRRRVI